MVQAQEASVREVQLAASAMALWQGHHGGVRDRWEEVVQWSHLRLLLVVKRCPSRQIEGQEAFGGEGERREGCGGRAYRKFRQERAICDLRWPQTLAECRYDVLIKFVRLVLHEVVRSSSVPRRGKPYCRTVLGPIA